MSDTRYFCISQFATELSVLLADDNPDVIEKFNEVFHDFRWSEMKMEDFARYIADATAIARRIVILDGTLFQGSKTSSIGDWLRKRDLQSNDHLFLIGYSGDDSNNTSRCVRWYLKGASPRGDAEELRKLCKDTAEGKKIADWPKRLTNIQAAISKAIHHLQNLVLPIALDAATLSEIPKRITDANKRNDKGEREKAIVDIESVIKDIFKDHFGIEECGYLSKKSKQNDKSEIINHVEDSLKTLPKDTEKLTETFNEFDRAVQDAMDWVKNDQTARVYFDFPKLHAKIMSILSAREKNEQSDCLDVDFLKKLSEKLMSISITGEKIVEELKVIQKAQVEAGK